MNMVICTRPPPNRHSGIWGGFETAHRDQALLKAFGTPSVLQTVRQGYSAVHRPGAYVSVIPGGNSGGSVNCSNSIDPVE